VFATNEAGKTFIVKVSPKACEAVADNQLGDEVYATPTICGSHIYMRVASLKDGQRHETLYCLGAGK
jgi:hypothetical protein